MLFVHCAVASLERRRPHHRKSPRATRRGKRRPSTTTRTTPRRGPRCSRSCMPGSIPPPLRPLPPRRRHRLHRETVVRAGWLSPPSQHRKETKATANTDLCPLFIDSTAVSSTNNSSSPRSSSSFSFQRDQLFLCLSPRFLFSFFSLSSRENMNSFKPSGYACSSSSLSSLALSPCC